MPYSKRVLRQRLSSHIRRRRTCRIRPKAPHSQQIACAREQIRTRLHLLVRPPAVIRARRLPLDTCRRVAVRGLDERDELRVRVRVILD
jgi:hypothetical protein